MESSSRRLGHAARALTALDGADVFFGLSVKGAVTKDMVRRMADKPIIFAMSRSRDHPGGSA